MNRLTSRLDALVDRFIAVSYFVREHHVIGGFDSARIDVKYNGVALPSYSPTISSERAGVLFAGRLSPSKGTQIVGELFPMMGGVPFHVVGSGPELTQLRSQANGHLNVDVAGRVDHSHLLELMSTVRCVVVPSVFPEPFGLTAVEAMAMGTPVVASRIGGLSELIEQSNAGILVDVADGSIGFACAIQTILDDAELAQNFGSNGQAFVQSRCSVEATTKQLIEIYETVCRRSDT